MTVELQRSTFPQYREAALTWRPVHIDNRWSAALTCGNGHYGLIDEHQIAHDGVVTPSVVCTESGCYWHEWVVLVGWAEFVGRVDISE